MLKPLLEVCNLTISNMAQNRTTNTSPTVLLVDPSQTVSDRLSPPGYEPPFALRVESNLEASRTHLATAGVGCLVLYPDSLDGPSLQDFVHDMRTIAPDCPLVLFTNRSAEELPEELLTHTTTLVERAAEPDNWRFLVEKVQSALEVSPTDHEHDEMYRKLVETARDGLYRLDRYGHVVYANESWAEMLGYDRAELLGSHASRTMAEGELESGQRIIQQVLDDDDRESDIIDLEMNTKEGDHITVAVHFVVLTTEEGAYDGVMGVVRDVTERRATERELERKNERLNQFVSTVSHDLRNPLNVAQGRLELALEECDSEHHAAIDRALRRMDALIGDLLTLAKEGKQVTEVESVELSAVCQHCWRNVETADATLRARTDSTVRADRTRLKHLFENLIRNAVEHGDDDVVVTVGDLTDGFYVADDGPGIPEEDRQAVFEVGNTTTKDGTGFGLSIVKQVVEAHDWDIRAMEGSAGGARFEITGVRLADE